MSKIKRVKKAIHSTPVIGTFYDFAWIIYNYFRWLRFCRKGRLYMTDSGPSRFDRANPLKLDGLNFVEIHPSPKANLFQNNPTINLEGNGLRIYWRITNWRDSPDATFWGRPKVKIAMTAARLISQTGTGFLAIQDGVISDVMQDERIVVELNPQRSLSGEAKKSTHSDLVPNVTFEDPKVLVSDPSLLAVTAVEQGETSDYLVTKAMVALLDLKKGNVVPLRAPNLNKIEKNWVLAKSDSESVTLLRQSNPHHLVVVDRQSGDLIREEFQPPSKKAFLHGGSGFVLVDGSFYLRVARHRISLHKARLVHVNHIIKHDLDFNEIARSKPFIFRKFAFEICNGMDYDGSHFYFSWGENDEKIFVGSITKPELLNWFERNKSTLN